MYKKGDGLSRKIDRKIWEPFLRHLAASPATKRTLMITISNRVHFVKSPICGVEEVLYFFQRPVDPRLNLTLAPTTLQSYITIQIDDYGKKGNTEKPLSEKNRVPSDSVFER